LNREDLGEDVAEIMKELLDIHKKQSLV